MKLKRSFPVLALALAAIALAASPSAFATDIDFSCSDGSGTTTGSAPICSGSSPVTGSPVTLLTWTEGVYTVTNTTTPASDLLYNPNQGDLPPGTTGLYSATGGDSLTVAAGTADFVFQGVNIGSNGNDDLFYTITGSLNSVTQFTETGEICDVANPCALVGRQATYYSIGGNADGINLLTISLTDNSTNNQHAAYLDNIDVVTPEPNGLLLLGTGMFALAFVLRRKLFA